MFDFLSGWSAGQVIALVSVVGGLLTVVLSVIAIAWSHVRTTEIAADLKRDLIQRGLTVEQIERLAAGPPPEEEFINEKELEANLASVLVQHEVPGHLLDEVLRVYQSTDAKTKKAVYDSLCEILESEASEEQLLAAVRTLCLPKAVRAAPRLESSPAGI